MYNIITGTNNKNLISQEQRIQILKTAHHNLGDKFAVSIDKYAAIKGISKEDAEEFDLNSDGKISIGEEISAICGQKIFNREINPSIILYAIYNSFGLRQLDSKAEDKLDMLG